MYPLPYIIRRQRDAKFNKRHSFAMISDAGVPISVDSAIWVDAHDRHQPVCVAERADPGDQARDPALLRSAQ